MLYKIKDKTINIPDAEIEKNIKVLDLTKEEAVQMWLEDEGYLVNETVEELTEKAKINKTDKHSAKSLKPRKPTIRERKPDEEKEMLIELLFDYLKKEGYDAQIVNKSKIIEFNAGTSHYKLDLIRQRNKT